MQLLSVVFEIYPRIVTILFSSFHCVYGFVVIAVIIILSSSSSCGGGGSSSSSSSGNNEMEGVYNTINYV